MYTFKKFVILKEYITPKQKKTINENGIEMSPEARKNTDHFFGEGNDVKREDIIDYKHDKSEIHRKVENHLNQSLSHEEYTSGITKDKYGRDAKIGRMIKDEQLRNEFASDNTRSGSKSVKKPYMSVVRGVHVMGQTNPEPDDIHPTGHAWSQQSCKNIKDGSNNRYLKHEVKHGTVVVFGHDHDGKEIYRATLQPHANDQKHVAYGVDSEYGIKHPSFTKHAKDVASRLSGEHKGGSFFEGIIDDADTSKAMEYFYEHLSEYNISYNKACINYDETRLDELDEKYILEVNNVRVKMSDNVISLIIGLLNDYDEEKDNWRILDV